MAARCCTPRPAQPSRPSLVPLVCSAFSLLSFPLSPLVSVFLLLSVSVSPSVSLSLDSLPPYLSLSLCLWLPPRLPLVALLPHRFAPSDRHPVWLSRARCVPPGLAGLGWGTRSYGPCEAAPSSPSLTWGRPREEVTGAALSPAGPAVCLRCRDAAHSYPWAKSLPPISQSLPHPLLRPPSLREARASPSWVWLPACRWPSALSWGKSPGPALSGWPRDAPSSLFPPRGVGGGGAADHQGPDCRHGGSLLSPKNRQQSQGQAGPPKSPRPQAAPELITEELGPAQGGTGGQWCPGL